MKNQTLARPPRINLFKELRAVKDVATMPGHLLLTKAFKRRQPAKGTPVLLIPGIGGSDRVMAPFKRYLELAGYRCFGWGMGTNLAGLNQKFDQSELTWEVDPSFKNNGELGVPYLCDRMVERTRKNMCLYL